MHKAKLWIFITASCLFAATYHAFAEDQFATTLQCSYTVKPNDYLSKILFKNGIGTKNSSYRLYGRRGWLRRTIERNPTVSSWNNLEAGMQIVVILPKALSETCPIGTTIVVSESAKTPEPQQSKVENESEVIEQKPAEQTVINPQKQIDSLKIRDLISANIDVRYARSIEPKGDTLLLPELNQYSVVFESRYAALKKVRVYADYLPLVTDDFLEKTFKLESMRLFLGRSFIWDFDGIVSAEIIPKFGYWRYASVLPLVDTEGVKAVKLGFSKQLSLGGDLALFRKVGMFTPRIWHGREFTANFLKSGDSAAGQNYRTGLETRIDGSTFSTRDASNRYYVMLFAMEESTKISNGTASILSGAKDNIGSSTATAGDERKDVSYHVKYIGFGLGLSW